MQVEFLGIPRERAGVSELAIEAETLGQLLGALAVRFPALAGLIDSDRLHPSLAANLTAMRSSAIRPRRSPRTTTC
jgi:hypothetical protein